MDPDTFLKIAIEPALSLLPEDMASPSAKRFLLAICLQESNLKYRRQIAGPARGWPMFEINGIRGVVNHKSTRQHVINLLAKLGYPDPSKGLDVIHAAFEHNDALSLAFARLLVYTLPGTLPASEADGWSQYLAAWGPGKPHPETWPDNWALASATVGV